MHDATKRFEIETLLKADLPKARVAEIAEVSVRTVHRVRAEIEARSNTASKGIPPQCWKCSASERTSVSVRWSATSLTSA